MHMHLDGIASGLTSRRSALALAATPDRPHDGMPASAALRQRRSGPKTHVAPNSMGTV